MTTAAGLRAGRAYVELGVDNNQLSAGLRAASGQLRAFGSSLQAVGMNMMKVGGVIALPMIGAITTFASFEKQMARVKAISNSTPEEFARLSAEAKRLGEVTEYSATQAAAMMTEFATRGYKVNDMLAAAGPALQMATAGQLELAEAAGIAGDIMGGMRIQAKDLGEVTDKLTYAFSNSATDLRQLGEAFKYVGPSASDMGFSLDEVSSALMVLANNGQKADMAGTTLRGIFETLKDPPSEARKELEKLGVVLDNGRGKFRKLDEIIGDMQQGLSKLSKVDKAAAISRIFTNRQTTGTSILVGENDKGVANVDVMRDFQTRLDTEAGGTGNRVQATMLDTLWGSWKLIESAIEGVAITIGETLMPTLREMGSAIITNIGIFNDFIKANKEWLPVAFKAALAIGGIGAALVATGASFGLIGFAVGGLAPLFNVLGASANMFVGSLGMIGTVGKFAIGFLFSPLGKLRLIAGGIAAAFSAIVPILGTLLSPVGLFVGAVAIAATVIYNMEGAGQALKVVLGGVAAGAILAVAGIGLLVEAAKAVGSAIVWAVTSAAEYMQKAFPAAIAEVTGTFRDMGQNLANLWDGLAKTFGETWDGIVDAISSGNLEVAAKIAWKGMEVVWQKGVNWVSGLWRGFTSYFVEAFHQAGYVLAHTVNSIWSGLESTWFESFNLIGSAWGYLMDFMRKSFVTASASISGGLLGLQAAIGAIDLKDLERKMVDISVKATVEKDKIDEERKASNKDVGKQRADIETRRADAEGVLLDQQIKEANNRRAARLAAETENTRKLVDAEAELADALTLVERIKRAKSGKWFGNYDSWFGDFEDKAPTKKDLDAVGERATGMGVGGGSAGTFDANMLRFLAGTGNEDILQKRQAEAAEKAAERLQRLIDIARENTNTYT